jgi:hypothetical protein
MAGMMRPKELRFLLTAIGPLLAVALLSACRTAAPLPAVDLNAPGWTLYQGQALWRTKRDAPEVAGEIVFATNRRGETLLQLTKNPLPFVTVQTRGDAWEIEFVPEHRRFRGRGTPGTRLSWVHLARALNGAALEPPLRFEQTAERGFTLRNSETGESITGFLNQ